MLRAEIGGIRDSRFPFGVARILPTVLVLALPLAGACARETESPVVPGTSITVADGLFLPGRNSKLRLAPSLRGGLCGDVAVLRGSHASSLGVTMADNDLLLLTGTATCGINIAERLPAEGRANSIKFSNNGCAYVFDMADHAIRRINLTSYPFNTEQVEKCVVRSGLFLSGVQGALSISDQKLFIDVESSPWAFFPKMPRKVPVLYYLLKKCGIDPEKISTRSQLSGKISCGKP